MIMTNWRHVVLAGWILLFLGGCNLPAPVAENQVEQPQASTLTAKAVDALVLTQLAPTAIQVVYGNRPGLRDGNNLSNRPSNSYHTHPHFESRD